MNTATRTRIQYSIQISTDGGKSWRTVRNTPDRSRAFDAYLRWSDGNRARMFKGNDLMLTTHLEDAEAELDKIAAKRA